MAKHSLLLCSILLSSTRSMFIVEANPDLLHQQLHRPLPPASFNTGCAISLNLTSFPPSFASLDPEPSLQIVINCSRFAPVESGPKLPRFVHTVKFDRDGQGMVSWKPGAACVSRKSGCGINSCNIHVSMEDASGSGSELMVAPSFVMWKGVARFQAWDIKLQEHPCREQRRSGSTTMSAVYAAILAYVLIVALASVPKRLRISWRVSVGFVDDEKRLDQLSPEKEFCMLLYPSGCRASDKELLDEKVLDSLHETKSVQLDLFSDTAWMS